MKKILVIIITMLFIVTGCSQKKTDFKFNETDEYKKLISNKENMTDLIIRYDTVAGRICYKANQEMTSDLYDMITSIEVLKETDIVTNDNDDFYKFYFNDSTNVIFAFNGKNYTYKDKIYTIKNYKAKSIIDLEGYEIDCDDYY